MPHQYFLSLRNRRFKAVGSEREREDLFEDYLTFLEAKEREELKAKREAAMKKFRQTLDSSTELDGGSQWRKVKEKFEENEVMFAIVSVIDLDHGAGFVRFRHPMYVL